MYHLTTDPCSLPPYKGPCYGDIPKYFYNTTNEKCEVFSYGGCFPNKNNFMNKTDCEEQCLCKFIMNISDYKVLSYSIQ